MAWQFLWHLQKTCILWVQLVHLFPERTCSHYLNVFIKGFCFFFPHFDTQQHLLASISGKTVATVGPQVLLSKQAHTHIQRKRKINRYFSIQKLRWAHLSIQKICALKSVCVCLLGFSCFVIPSDQLGFQSCSQRRYITLMVRYLLKMFFQFEFVWPHWKFWKSHFIVCVFRQSWPRIFQNKVFSSELTSSSKEKCF